MPAAPPTPLQLGFRLPAEWEPHSATWLAWPHNRRDWPGKFATIPWVYGEIVKRLSRKERVCLLTPGERQEQQARRVFEKCGANLDHIRFYRCPTNRSWTRDTAPIFLKHDETGEVAITNWRFNGWAKYDNWQQDDAVPDYVARRLGLRQFRPTVAGRRFVLEGGSIDSNGAGALLTTEECLLSPVQARNPHLTREEIERTLCDYLGVRKILWLRNGIAGDDTHGHVDDLARFVNPRTVVIGAETNSADVNYGPLRENLRLLRGMTDQKGDPLEVVTLPMPQPVVFAGQRLPASYANFYIANGLVLAPTFNDPADRVALRTLERLFPGREIVGIHAVDLVWGLGALHCMTQQQPA